MSLQDKYVAKGGKRGPQAKCKHHGCEEKPTGRVQIELTERTGHKRTAHSIQTTYAAISGRSISLCEEHAMELYDKLLAELEKVRG